MNISKRYIKRPVISHRLANILQQKPLSVDNNKIKYEEIVKKDEKVVETAHIIIEETQIVPDNEIKENEAAEITSNEEIQVEEKKEVKKPKRKRKTKDIETNENNELKEE